MAHVAQRKYDEVEHLVNILTTKKVIGITEIGGIPSPQMQKMRKNIRENAIIRSSKNNLINLALDEAEKKVKGISKLKQNITGQTAIIATDMNPFKLAGQMKQTRTMAPARGGETAPNDIEVKAGDTPFKPGPIVGELQQVGIPAAIQDGKVVIREDKVIVPEGEKIPANVAQMLTRLEIYPIEIGMILHAVYEDGIIYKPDVLDVDMDVFMGQIKTASCNAFNLAIESGWITPLTIQPLLQKAHHQAFVLAIEKNILSKETIKHMLAKAYGSMLSLAPHAKDALDEDLKKRITT